MKNVTAPRSQKGSVAGRWASWVVGPGGPLGCQGGWAFESRVCSCTGWGGSGLTRVDL